jgi:hypothetical protein
VAVNAEVLLNPNVHACRIYPLSTEAISPNEMAVVASSVCGVEITPQTLSPKAFQELALCPQAMVDQQDGFLSTYMNSVTQMFQGVAVGRYTAHSQTFS